MATAQKTIPELPPLQATQRVVRTVSRRVDRAAGGRARARVVILFAGVEALASADLGTVGAVAPQLERTLHIGDAQIGIIAAVAALAGAAGTIPAGWLTDRVRRVRLMVASIVLWCAAMVLSALAPSFLVLVLARVALGAVTATAGPTVASLTGDFFPAEERAKIWGLILSGELLGAGIGVVGSGNLAGALSWRYGFAWLAVPGLLLALAMRKLLVEPARGGQSRLRRGAERMISAEEVAAADSAGGDEVGAGAMLEEDQELAQKAVREDHEEPHPELVLHGDPVGMPLWSALRYVLRIRTNVVLIFANSLGYLFFAGVQTFAVLLLRSRYGISQSAASFLLLAVGGGALLGVLVSGRVADRLLARGHTSARVVVAAVCYLVAAVIFVPGLSSSLLYVSVPLFILAAAALAGPDPPLSAARLDIMHPRLWGRAESARTVLRMLALAGGPLLFGLISGALGGPTNSMATGGSIGRSPDLAYAFLIMLIPVALSGIILLFARRTYPRDVATAAASIEAAANPD